jgi:two-component sensor histidine kinase
MGTGVVRRTTGARVDASRTELRIPAASIGPALARAAVPTVVPPLPAATMADLQLLVSELVSNAIEDAGDRASEDIRVVVLASPGSVRIELSAARRLPAPAPGGWGTLLLDRLASAWGYDDDDDDRGTPRIWFEVPTA